MFRKAGVAMSENDVLILSTKLDKMQEKMQEDLSDIREQVAVLESKVDLLINGKINIGKPDKKLERSEKEKDDANAKVAITAINSIKAITLAIVSILSGFISAIVTHYFGKGGAQ